MDHGQADKLQGAGWGIALICGALAGGLAGWLGAPTGGAMIIALTGFGVFGVLMGKGGVELTAPPHDDHHGDHH